ncbi:hypothetical protein Agub_g10005, partial [Astrephomene gubernaculifera]
MAWEDFGEATANAPGRPDPGPPGGIIPASNSSYSQLATKSHHPHHHPYNLHQQHNYTLHRSSAAFDCTAAYGTAAGSSFSVVPSLRALCLGFLGRHVQMLAEQLGPHLGPLPPDVKACLLCVARRRHCLTNRVLLALADEGWPLLDLAGAVRLSERAIRQ